MTAGNSLEQAARRYFAGTPLYLETMLRSWIVPRQVEYVSTVISDFEAHTVRIVYTVYEGPLHPAE